MDFMAFYNQKMIRCKAFVILKNWWYLRWKDEKKKQEKSNSKDIYLLNRCTPFTQGMVWKLDIMPFA